MMDIGPKEQFLKEYDEHIRKILLGGVNNFSENYWNWLDFLSDTNIASVRIAFIWVTEYSSLDEFNKNQKEIFSIQSTSSLTRKEDAIWFFLSTVEEKFVFWEDFVFLRCALFNFEEERIEFFGTSYFGFLSRFENIGKALREIFVKCLDLNDSDPTVDDNEQRKIPASDRIVKINHNDPKHQEIIEKLEELEASISKSNSIENEDKDRLQAELKAGEGILKGKTARIEVIKTLLVKGLKYIIKHVTDAAIVFAAEYLLKLICQYFGLTG